MKTSTEKCSEKEVVWNKCVQKPLVKIHERYLCSSLLLKLQVIQLFSKRLPSPPPTPTKNASVLHEIFFNFKIFFILMPPLFQRISQTPGEDQQNGKHIVSVTSSNP